jgi:hypothetical protein
MAPLQLQPFLRMIRNKIAGLDPEWTGQLVLRGLRLAFTDAPRFGQEPAQFRFILEHAREVLGPNSPEFTALILRVSRSELYRRSNNGAVRVAAALAAAGVAVPDGLGKA